MSISTNVYDITLTRGDDEIHKITVKNTDETVKDITGATARYTVRKDAPGGTQVFQVTTSDDIALTSPTTGVLQATLSSANTALLSAGRRYYYDCEVTLSGSKQTVQTGEITVREQVSS